MQNVLKICFKRPGITMKGSKRNTPVDLFFAFHEIYKSRIKKNRKMCFHVMEILFRILAATVSAVGKSNLSPGSSLNRTTSIIICISIIVVTKIQIQNYLSSSISSSRDSFSLERLVSLKPDVPGPCE